MSSKAGLFDKLDQEWAVFATSGEGRGGLLRFAASEPDLAGFATLDSLLEALRGRVTPGRRDERMLALLRLARHDPAARRVALQVVRPALSGIARPYFVRWGAADASSTVIVVALERIATFPTDRRQTNLAGHIVRDTRHVLFERLGRELAFENVFDSPRHLSEVGDRLVAPPDRTAAERVTVIVADAVRAGKITRRHAQLVLDSRLGGVTIHEIAAAWHRPPQTVRRMRHRVERILADVAVA
ncbi:MAG: hypothetical protein ACRD03_12215 [Acidimicrobiales bacterium]